MIQAKTSLLKMSCFCLSFLQEVIWERQNFSKQLTLVEWLVLATPGSLCSRWAGQWVSEWLTRRHCAHKDVQVDVENSKAF